MTRTIEVNGLTKYYGDFLAIDDLVFSASQGEIVGFLGPNGAGKTTTMRILTGYMPPTTGSASVAGFDVVDESLEVRKRIGYLPETLPLYPELSVYEYLSYMGSLRNVPDLDSEIESILQTVHLSDRMDSLIGNLSKGLKQRVGLAQALIHHPAILILDEPSLGLDPGQIIEVRNLIRTLKQDRTILLSTHILSEAQQVCDRVLIINKGRIVAEDSPSNLQAQLAGGERIMVRAGIETQGLIETLQMIQGVSSVSPAGEEGLVEVESKPGKDLRPIVARKVVESGADLLELRSVSLDLEKIFLELTREDQSMRNEGE